MTYWKRMLVSASINKILDLTSTGSMALNNSFHFLKLYCSQLEDESVVLFWSLGSPTAPGPSHRDSDSTGPKGSQSDSATDYSWTTIWENLPHTKDNNLKRFGTLSSNMCSQALFSNYNTNISIFMVIYKIIMYIPI